MEDGLGVFAEMYSGDGLGLVLILVLVEDGLGVFAEMYSGDGLGLVLILVLVEDGLGEFANKLFAILIMWS